MTTELRGERAAFVAATVVRVTTPGGIILHRDFGCKRAPAEVSPFAEVVAMPAKLATSRLCRSCMVAIDGSPHQWAHAKRYRLSNGWFIDGATVSHGYYGSDKYTLWEPGASPAGCAALRGSAPTLALMLAVANGAQPCGRTFCRNLATGRTAVTVRGHEGFTFHCDQHAPAPAIAAGAPKPAELEAPYRIARPHREQITSAPSIDRILSDSARATWEDAGRPDAVISPATSY